jgi:hypothetical protein
MNMRNILPITAVLAGALMLAACGGDGSDAASAPAPASSWPSSVPAPIQVTPPPVASDDLSLARRLYRGDERTPSEFDVETRPANVIGTLSTRHLLNTDLAGGPQGISATFEVCTNDMAQAIDWSERQATWGSQYSDLVEVRSDAHMFEVARVPRADVTAMLRHRVFRCDYLDRSGSNLRADVGAAGNMNQRPLTAAELEALTEYLWQFTKFNNADFAVQSSAAATTDGALVQTIRMGQLVRGAAGACDTVQLMDWTHTMDPNDGALSRALNNVRSYQVMRTSNGAQTCGA